MKNPYPGFDRSTTPVKTLKIPPDTAIRLLGAKLDEIEDMLRSGQVLLYYDFVGWCSGVWSMIDDIYRPGTRYQDEIRNIGVPRCSCSDSADVQQMLLETYHNHLMVYLDEIRNMSGKQEAV